MDRLCLESLKKGFTAEDAENAEEKNPRPSWFINNLCSYCQLRKKFPILWAFKTSNTSERYLEFQKRFSRKAAKNAKHCTTQ
jgi:hypothetical protein